MKALVSIIVPVYNVQQYLDRCLKSLVGQTYQNIEILLVDDGSRDSSGELCDLWGTRDDRIKVFHKENGGVTSARLRGVREAKGEWIGFVDGDDAVEPEMYEHLLANARKYEAQISHCGYKLIFEDGRERFFYNTGMLMHNDRIEGLRELLTGAVVEPGLWNKLFRRELFSVLLDDNKMDMSIRINEDLLMNYYLFREAKQTVYEDFCPYHYYVRRTSATRSGVLKRTLHDLIKVKELILADIPAELEKEAKRGYIGACVGVCSSIARANSGAYEAEYRDAVRRIRERLDWFPLLNRKLQIYVLLILCLGKFYGAFYRFYFNNLSKKPYD